MKDSVWILQSSSKIPETFWHILRSAQICGDHNSLVMDSFISWMHHTCDWYDKWTDERCNGVAFLRTYWAHMICGSPNLPYIFPVESSFVLNAKKLQQWCIFRVLWKSIVIISFISSMHASYWSIGGHCDELTFFTDTDHIWCSKAQT